MTTCFTTDIYFGHPTVCVYVPNMSVFGRALRFGMRTLLSFVLSCTIEEKLGNEQTMSSDLDRLQGKWAQVAFEENGFVDPPDSHGADGAVMTISGQSFHVAIPGGETLIEGRFTLDHAANPKSIDWMDSMGDDAGKTLPAIYRLADDRFEFAAADADMARPEGFHGGQGITIRGFIRL